MAAFAAGGTASLRSITMSHMRYHLDRKDVVAADLHNPEPPGDHDSDPRAAPAT